MAYVGGLRKPANNKGPNRGITGLFIVNIQARPPTIIFAPKEMHPGWGVILDPHFRTHETFYKGFPGAAFLRKSSVSYISAPPKLIIVASDGPSGPILGISFLKNAAKHLKCSCRPEMDTFKI